MDDQTPKRAAALSGGQGRSEGGLNGGLVHSSTGFLVVLVSGGFWVQVVVGGSQWSWMVPLAPLGWV